MSQCRDVFFKDQTDNSTLAEHFARSLWTAIKVHISRVTGTVEVSHYGNNNNPCVTPVFITPWY